jgi:glycosyltransferase involved in cell wall biosynthesis
MTRVAREVAPSATASAPGGQEPVAPVRVALDARALTDASAFRGVGTYVRNLVAALADRPDVAVTAVLPRRRIAPDRWATLEHHLRLPGELARTPADVNHSPALDPPRRSTRPWVQTVPDLLPLVSDDPAFSVERRRWRRWAPRVRAAAAVITFSRHGADQALTHLGLEPARIHVIPLAAGPEFRPGAGAPSIPYVLHVGEYGPHKGFGTAASLAATLAAAHLPHELWMAGRVVDDNRGPVEAALAGAGPEARSRIRLLGLVPDLVSVYQGAAALVVTSRHEGFGLPALEAMACGVPVVAFANSAVVEVVGDAGTLVPDGDGARLAEELVGLLRSDARRAELSAAGLARAAAFSWRRTADAHAEVYRSVACG